MSRASTLGYVLLHIYDFDPGGAIYLPQVEAYEPNTPCIVVGSEENSVHQECLSKGYTNWLNVAVVSDTCDDVENQTETALVSAFNEDCRDGGWLWKMMNPK